MTTGEPIFSAIFVVFTGAAVLAAGALYARQPLPVAYIVLGGVLGPWGLQWVSESAVIREIGHTGIIFLLFLLGLNLHPQKLIAMLREALLVTLLGLIAVAVPVGAIAGLFGFAPLESVLIGAGAALSSTIIGLKLLPTLELHHRRLGEIIISVLLLQDVLAIAVLLLLQGMGGDGAPWRGALLAGLALPGLLGAAYLFQRYVLLPLMARFDTIHEYIFLTAIGWCLGMAQLATMLGLSHEIGAFIAGVALAASPISRYIAESLKTLRDFFLILFFFSLGAGFDLPMLPEVLAPALLIAGLVLLAKPLVLQWLLRNTGESSALSREAGVRLGQFSEFSLLIAVLAVQGGVIGERASYLIQAATLLSFIGSSYWITLRYPTPIAVNARLHRG